MTMAEQLAAVNMQLLSSQEQLAALSKAIDTVRQEASDAVTDLRNGLLKEQIKSKEMTDYITKFGQAQNPQGGGYKEREMSLVNTKEFHGGQFAGAKNESFKIWGRKVRIFCNAQKQGFRKVLEDVENNEDVEIGARQIAEMAWEHAQTADAKLADFLATPPPTTRWRW